MAEQKGFRRAPLSFLCLLEELLNDDDHCITFLFIEAYIISSPYLLCLQVQMKAYVFQFKVK